MFESQIYMIRIYKYIVFHVFVVAFLNTWFYIFFMSYESWTMSYVEILWSSLWIVLKMTGPNAKHPLSDD